MRYFMPERVPLDKEILKMEENLSAYITVAAKTDKEVMLRLNKVAYAYKQARFSQNLLDKRIGGRG